MNKISWLTLSAFVLGQLNMAAIWLFSTNLLTAALIGAIGGALIAVLLWVFDEL